VVWTHNGRVITDSDSHLYLVQDDSSLLFRSITDFHSGNYTINAQNAVGEASDAVSVVVFPIEPTLELEIEKNMVAPGEVMELKCRVNSYPPATVTWYKKPYRQTDMLLENDGMRISVDSIQESQLSLLSTLTVQDVTDGDTATYKCIAITDEGRKYTKKTSVSVQYGPGAHCIDRPAYRNCHLVVRNRYCYDSYYAKMCCRSCALAGQTIP